MSKRSIFVALFGLTMIVPAPVVAADKEAPKNKKPALILRLSPLDRLRSDIHYLAEVIGQEEKVKQLDEVIKSKLGDKGLQSIDTKKSMAIYGWVGEIGIDSKVVVLVPIADKKAFLDLLSDALDVKPEKGEDDVYTLNVDKVPVPVYLRFANNYAYITARDKEVLDKDQLLTPAAVLPDGQAGATSLTLNIDEFPDDLKDKALAAIENHLAGLKDKEMPGHTQSQKKLHDSAVDEISAVLKSLLKHGGAATLREEIDQKNGDLAITLNVAAKPDSPLAKTLHNLGQVQSRTASLLHPDSALKGEVNVNLPAKLRELLAPALQDAEKQLLTKAKDDNQREVIKPLLEGIMPTLKAAELDTAIDLRGPSEKGLFTVVAGIKIKEGAKMEASLRKTAERLPKQINLDVEKVDQVSIHRINAEKHLKADTRHRIGNNPAYIAIRDDVLFLGAGEKGLSALKEALAAAPRTGKVLELQIALSQLAPLFDDPTQADIARQVFGDNKGSDRVRISVEGGSALTMRLSFKAKLIDYVNRVEKAKK